MHAEEIWIRHIAAPAVEGVQRCVVCEVTLIDRHGEMTLDADAFQEMWWSPGTPVYVHGGVSSVFEPDALATSCAPR